MNLYIDELIKIRRELHKIPEIAYGEFQTCEYICKKLSSYTIDHKVVFHTGVVAIIGNPQKECIAFRMDMDALPVTERNTISYKSEFDGMMHACGHDGHVAMLLTAAKILKENEEKLNKCIKLIFQPAEEGSGGAEPMITEGVLQNPDVKEVYGFHLWPDTPVGKAEFVPKTAFAGSYRYKITVKGKGGHGAIPSGVLNSLIPASALILEISKMDFSEENAVISACAVHAGGTFNVFPDDTEILGTIRTLNQNDTDRILAKMKNLTEEISQKYEIAIIFEPVFEYPPCINDDHTLKNMVEKAKLAIGEENVIEGEKTFGAEDFAYFGRNTKAAHMRIGSKNINDASTHYPLHNPNFNIDEAALAVGLRIILEIALD